MIHKVFEVRDEYISIIERRKRSSRVRWLVCVWAGGISLLSSFFLGSKVELVAMGDQ